MKFKRNIIDRWKYTDIVYESAWIDGERLKSIGASIDNISKKRKNRRIVHPTIAFWASDESDTHESTAFFVLSMDDLDSIIKMLQNIKRESESIQSEMSEDLLGSLNYEMPLIRLQFGLDKVITDE